MALEAARRDGTKVEPNPSYGPKHLSREGQKVPTKAVKSYTENSLENKKKYLKTAKSSETSLKKKGEKAKGPKNPTKKGQKKTPKTNRPSETTQPQKNGAKSCTQSALQNSSKSEKACEQLKRSCRNRQKVNNKRLKMCF